MSETTDRSAGRGSPEVGPAAAAAPVARRAGAYRRFFAWLMSRAQRHYGADVDAEKRRLLGALHGTVVEIGAGAGANLGFYPPGVDLILVEPNPYMHAYLMAEAWRHGIEIDIRSSVAEHIALDDGIADHVVSTLVLCSVDDLEASLREVSRLLKPGGSFVFLEHVAAPPGSRLLRWQRRLRGVWMRIGDGCRLERNTGEAIEAAGFAQLDYHRFEPRTLPLVRPHIAGVAVKAPAAAKTGQAAQ